MFIEDGFRKENDNYIKRTVVGATLLDSITETHTIKSYENFKTDVRDFTKDFAMPQGLDYTTIGFEGMQALLKQAMDSVPKEYAKIFGERDDDGNWKNAKYEKQYMKSEPYEKPMVRYDLATQQNVFYTVEKTRSIPTVETLDYNSYVTYQKALEDLSDDERGEKGQNERIVVTGNGLFTEWVGYAPVMKPGADPGVDVEDYQKNVRFDGSGETGRIMGMYIQHKMIEGAGWAECELPAYNRRLWDDRGSWMKAPTIRSLADVAMNVAATALGPGVGQIMLNLVDDAVFTMLDVANGMDFLTAAEGLAKKAATAVLVPKAGDLGLSGATNLLGDFGGTVIGGALEKGVQVFATNVATSGINAFSVSSLLDGGPLFDGDAFMEGAFGKSAMTSVVAGMAGYAVTEKLNQWNIDSLPGNLTATERRFETFNSTMGGLASTAVTYSMTGNAKVNLLNTSMLSKFGFTDKNGKPVNAGLFEYSFGDDGSYGAIGKDGTDLNIGKLATSAAVAGKGAVDAIEEYQKLVANTAREMYAHENQSGGTLSGIGYSAGKEAFMMQLSPGQVLDAGLKNWGVPKVDAAVEDLQGTGKVNGDGVNVLSLHLPQELKESIAEGTNTVYVGLVTGVGAGVQSMLMTEKLFSFFSDVVDNPAVSACDKMFGKDLESAIEYAKEFNYSDKTKEKPINKDSKDESNNAIDLFKRPIYTFQGSGSSFQPVFGYNFSAQMESGNLMDFLSEKPLGFEFGYTIANSSSFGNLNIGVGCYVSMTNPANIWSDYSKTNSAEKVSLSFSFTRPNVVVNTSYTTHINAWTAGFTWTSYLNRGSIR